MSQVSLNLDVFSKLRESILSLDPVFFVEKYLTLDGEPFRLHGNGYKPFADLYRYVGINALEENAKPILFVKGRQVGGTTMAAALELYFMACGLFGRNGHPPMRIMHCFPTLIASYAYAKTKLNPMITSAIPIPAKGLSKPISYIQSKLDLASPSNDSLQYKQFLGGSHIWIESTGQESDRLRGRTVDGIFFDEVQDTPKEAISNVLKSLLTSKYGPKGQGIQLFFGTPKRKQSHYYNMWMASTQQYYHLGCERCGEYFPLYTPGSDEWESIWIREFIVKCTKCGFEQDKRDAAERGKWIAANPNPNAKYIGFHLNQLYMPFITRERIEMEKPQNHISNTERAWQNEVLGEFFNGQDSPITADDIATHCADYGRKMITSILPSANKKVYCGFDWGEKNDPNAVAEGDTKGKSFSTSCIVTADGPDLLSIQFVHMFAKNDWESKKQTVDQIMRQFSVDRAVADIGYANDLVPTLQRTYGDRFLASRASGMLKNHAKFDDSVKIINFDKNYFIELLFNKMRTGKVRFPFGSYEQISWFISHCSSMEQKTVTTRGQISSMYVKGREPNDGFMALINAYLAFRFDITKGFTIADADPMSVSGVSNDNPFFTLYLPKLRGKL